MCGICGWYKKNDAIDCNELIAMNQIAKHRGPDDEGYSLILEKGIVNLIGEDSIDLSYEKIQEYKNTTCHLGFGHRRLSIIDLSSNGHQPMQSQDGEYCITFNGEIYNYIELKNELINKGYSFRSCSDTEVILMAYHEWGEKCVDHMNGMWAFAIWDNSNNKIFCSRDRLGAKPFHYYCDDENFIFGSEIKQLLQNSVVPKYLNERIAASSIFFGLTDYSEETLVGNVMVLRGGCNLSVILPRKQTDKIVVNKYQYWDLKNIGTGDVSNGEVFKTLRDAVRIRLRSDVPIGVMLSGGLDSSVMLSEIKTLSTECGLNIHDINTFTSCYDDFAEGDELEFAKDVNSYCGTRENLIYPKESDTFSVAKDMVWHLEELVEFSTMGAYLTLKEISKYGNKVILNGQGGDETMFGYEKYYVWYLKDVLKEKGLFAYLSELNRIVKNSKLSYKTILQYIVYFGNSTVRRIRCDKRMGPYVKKRIRRQFRDNKEIEKLIHFRNLAEMQYYEIKGAQLTNILRKDDRMYMAFSMESRVPFIDYRYVEGAASIPAERKIKDGYTKYLMREYIKGRLPDSVVWRKNKMGWPSPRNRWMDNLNEEEVNKLFDNPASEKLFDVNKIRKVWKKDPHSYVVEKFIGVELFMRLFGLSVSNDVTV